MSEDETTYDITRRRLGELIGEASMCWSETPQGIFESERASRIVDDAVAVAMGYAADQLIWATGGINNPAVSPDEFLAMLQSQIARLQETSSNGESSGDV